MKRDSDEKNRQNLATDYILQSYDGRLRFDTIAQKLQIYKPHPDTGEEEWYYLSDVHHSFGHAAVRCRISSCPQANRRHKIARIGCISAQ